MKRVFYWRRKRKKRRSGGGWGLLERRPRRSHREQGKSLLVRSRATRWFWVECDYLPIYALFWSSLLLSLFFFFPCKWPMCMEKSLICSSKGFMFSWWIPRLPHAYAFFTIRVSHTHFLTKACRNQASSTTPIFLLFILHPTSSLTWSLTGACYPSLLHIPIKTTHSSLHIHTTHTHPSCYS